MRRRTGLTLGVVISGAVAVLAIGSYATAQSGKSNVSTGPMSGYLEGAPGGPVSSAASGSFEASIDDAASEIDFTLTFADLEAPVLFAHIHFGQRSVNGGVAAFLCGGGGKPACPQSGTVTGTIVPADVVGPTGQGIAAGEFGELVAAIRAGRTYANVHSTKFPGGEVRGQINDDNQRDD
jgi:CHRD domain